MTVATDLQVRAENIAVLNDYLNRLTPDWRKRTIVALAQGEVISTVAAELLIEFHGLEAL